MDKVLYFYILKEATTLGEKTSARVKDFQMYASNSEVFLLGITSTFGREVNNIALLLNY